jgi:serine phosphatase RsbU (regulator of sigma subunit)
MRAASTPESARLKRTSGTFRLQTNEGTIERKPSGHLPVGRGKGRAGQLIPRGGGSEIGYDQVRGWSLRLKFLVFTLLVVLFITSLICYVAITSLRSSLLEEIIRSGHEQAVILSRFAQDVLLKVKKDVLLKKMAEVQDPQRKMIGEMIAALEKGEDPQMPIHNYSMPADKELFKSLLDEVENGPAGSTNNASVGYPYQNGVVAAYRGKHPEDARFLENQVNEGRVKDIVIFSLYSSKMPVLRATKSEYYTLSGEEVQFEEKVKDEEIYWGSYDNENCLYFRLPVEADLSPSFSANSAKKPGYLNLIISTAAIHYKVESLVVKLIFFGLIFAAAGLALAWYLAWVIAQPVNVLVEDVNIVAKGELEHESRVPNLTSDEIGLLARAFNRMTRNLRDARDKEREAQRLAGEVNTAKGIHMRLLPEKLPNLPEIFDIACAYHCAKEVGGDYYDFIPVGDAEHLGFCVADVSGKGIPGSMVMGTTRTYLRMMAVNNYSAADVLAKTNAWVSRDIKRGMFITCVYVILNMRTREMTVSSAGHNPLLIWRQATGQVEKLRPNGIALGFDKGPIFNRIIREEKIQLYSGDRVIMYTDGVVEAMNEKHEEWSDEKLERFTLNHAADSSKEYVRLLLKALMDHQGRAEQHDDITVVTFKMV